MKKILVANRGEIALRVMRTAQRLNIKTVAVYSDIDRHAPHVTYADEAVAIGPAPSKDSYLVIDRIIDAAKQTNADAIHPGYGFLSENAEFAKRVTDAGIVFMGPTPAAIETMGSKLAAKDAVKDYGIPMVPGIDHAITDVNIAKGIADDIGYPILIKASAGGGGKGMRIVHNPEDLEEQMNRAISEATSAFGNGEVFIEKYIASPRHIEIQVLADNHGNIIHLFERECSIQRRHQKVVEEAPSAVLTPDLRNSMGKAAVDVARACNYQGVGTVEFLLDENNKFYFLEMNTRLQVEHPVTELITGIDLVEQQIKVARGKHLTLQQSDLTIKGHAVELRVYAEDPYNDFSPSIGVLSKYNIPEMPGVRVDDGYTEGMEIPIYYDPMIAKLIAYADSRSAAIKLLKEAILNYDIEGIKTTLPFGLFVCDNEAFISGDIDTHFIKKYFTTEEIEKEDRANKEIAAKMAYYIYEQGKNVMKAPLSSNSNWKTAR